uniref:peptidylprolyl isomerase n=1 Tax=Fagus sylvatica TaxID=28930 RepID=A0A2N9G5B4_FAGSY
MNRRNTDNLVENLLGDFEYEVQAPYLLYRNAVQEVNGIWFYNARECEEVANLFSRASYEVALLTIAPEYAFGSSESQQELAVVPPNSTVYYEVEMVSFDKEKESWDMNTQEKIEAAGKKKEEGNVLFKAGKYARASKKYEKAVKYIEYDSAFEEEDKKQAKALKVACNLNDAACKLKLKEYKQVEKLCTKVYILWFDVLAKNCAPRFNVK